MRLVTLYLASGHAIILYCEGIYTIHKKHDPMVGHPVIERVSWKGGKNDELKYIDYGQVVAITESELDPSNSVVFEDGEVIPNN